ncbi:discoidin domain-containing protein [Paenibacillus sp. WLX2291]|uniref:discoidin domain-containing protein n=1 Tax=Paenibacillus sp. WLX2291 TaxID=3296934 RepID=UPI00398415C2
MMFKPAFRKVASIVCLITLFIGILTIPIHVNAEAETVAPSTDIAQGKTVRSSSAQSGYEAAKGNDGNTATRWIAKTNSSGEWWEVDLGNAYSVNSTQIMWAKNGIVYPYKIEVSTDHSHWITIVDNTNQSNTDQIQTNYAYATARYVKVTITGTVGDNEVSFYDCKVMAGYNGPVIDPERMQKVTGTSPIRFVDSDLAPGNYDITLLLGDNTSSSSASVVGEARREMLANFTTTAGTVSTQTFTMNVRSTESYPTYSNPGTVGLNFLLSGTAPKLQGIGIAPAQHPNMIYLIGDSTVADWPSGRKEIGWGQMLPQYFKLGTAIANYADPGDSTSSFLSNPSLFKAVIAQVQKSDYVLIQLGHNDKTTTKEKYQANLTSMITQIRSKEATPILITPTVRRLFNDDQATLSPTALHINNVGVDLVAAMKEVAVTHNVPLIDLTAKSKAMIESLGFEASKAIYLTVEANDNTHFSRYGANEMAKLVVQGMKELQLPQVANLRNP